MDCRQSLAAALLNPPQVISNYLLFIKAISVVFIKKLDENVGVWQFFSNFVARNRRGLRAVRVGVAK